MGYGGAQAVPLLPESTIPAIFPVAAMQQYVKAVGTCSWDIRRGYLFSVIDADGPIDDVAKREVAMTPQLPPRPGCFAKRISSIYTLPAIAVTRLRLSHR